jgi:threonine aldolase
MTAPARVSFASDNTAGADPRVLEALVVANALGHVPAYGADDVTARARALIAEAFGRDVQAFFVWGGTGANVTGLAAALRSHETVLCTDVAHIHVDECGAPEAFTGSKLTLVPHADGKLTVAALDAAFGGVGVEHHVQPAAISLTQSTEYGTVHTLDELRALAEWAHARRLLVHVDGARLANAAAALGASLRDVTFAAGADLVSFGLTKNGAIGAEVILVRDAAIAARLPFVRKQAMQLPSKHRFVAAQAAALLEDEHWRTNAAHANAMARRLADAVRDLPGLRITRPVEVNAVFAELPAAAITALQERFHFYVWNERRHEVRWMTAFDTPPDAVDAFTAAIRAELTR